MVFVGKQVLTLINKIISNNRQNEKWNTFDPVKMKLIPVRNDYKKLFTKQPFMSKKLNFTFFIQMISNFPYFNYNIKPKPFYDSTDRLQNDLIPLQTFPIHGTMKLGA